MAPGGLPRTPLPRTPPPRAIPRAAVAAASPQGSPAPGCGAAPSLAGGSPRAPVPGLPGALRRAASPCSPLPEDGRASSRTAPCYSRPRPSGGTGTDTGTGREGGSRGSRAGGGPSLPLLPHRPPAELSRLPPPGRSRFLSQGLSARIATRRLRLPARRRFSPLPARPPAPLRRYLGLRCSAALSSSPSPSPSPAS